MNGNNSRLFLNTFCIDISLPRQTELNWRVSWILDKFKIYSKLKITLNSWIRPYRLYLCLSEHVFHYRITFDDKSSSEMYNYIHEHWKRLIFLDLKKNRTYNKLKNNEYRTGGKALFQLNILYLLRINWCTLESKFFLQKHSTGFDVETEYSLD